MIATASGDVASRKELVEVERTAGDAAGSQEASGVQVAESTHRMEFGT